MHTTQSGLPARLQNQHWPLSSAYRLLSGAHRLKDHERYVGLLRKDPDALSDNI